MKMNTIMTKYFYEIQDIHLHLLMGPFQTHQSLSDHYHIVITFINCIKIWTKEAEANLKQRRQPPPAAVLRFFSTPQRSLLLKQPDSLFSMSRIVMALWKHTQVEITLPHHTATLNRHLTTGPPWSPHLQLPDAGTLVGDLFHGLVHEGDEHVEQQDVGEYDVEDE